MNERVVNFAKRINTSACGESAGAKKCKKYLPDNGEEEVQFAGPLFSDMLPLPLRPHLPALLRVLQHVLVLNKQMSNVVFVQV